MRLEKIQAKLAVNAQMLELAGGLDGVGDLELRGSPVRKMTRKNRIKKKESAEIFVFYPYFRDLNQ